MGRNGPGGASGVTLLNHCMFQGNLYSSRGRTNTRKGLENPTWMVFQTRV